MRRLVWVPLAICLSGLVCPQAEAVEPEPLLRVLKAVGPKGKGNIQAAMAWQELSAADAGQLPTILAGLDDAGPLAANWIRAAVDTIAERQLRASGKLPADRLEVFVNDTSHASRARRLAYEWLVRVDPSAKDRLLPKMLDDPSLELRRDAVAKLIREAEALADTERAADVPGVYEMALSAARDPDQVKLLAQRLKDLGRPIDLALAFGFIQRWKVVGPFDNTDEKGFDLVYPPERKLDFGTRLAGKNGQVEWTDHVGKDPSGKIDFDAIYSPQKEVCAYAATKFISPEQREVEFRFSSRNAVKLWLNGKLIAQHNIYHGGLEMDQYVSTRRLKAGPNTLLIKVCQNAQTQDWAKHWSFHLRVCDANGGGIPSADRDHNPSSPAASGGISKPHPPVPPDAAGGLGQR